MEHHSYSWSTPDCASVGETERSHERSVVAETAQSSCTRGGTPEKCYCGASPVIHTSTNVSNLSRRYYTCGNGDGGGCLFWKWWDEAVEEEFRSITSDEEEVKNGLRYFTVDAKGENVDTRLMWANVQYSRDEVYRLKVLSEEVEVKVAVLESMVNDLLTRSPSPCVQRNVVAVREMKIITATTMLVVALVAIFGSLLK